MNYVDVDVFVYWLTDHPSFGKRASEIIKGIERGEKACTSSFTIWLLHVLLEWEAENYSEEILLRCIQELSHLKVIPLEMQDFKGGEQYRNAFRIDFKHSIHYAVARRMGAQTIYSNDSDFDKTDLERVF